jgi:hypothetical protein
MFLQSPTRTFREQSTAPPVRLPVRDDFSRPVGDHLCYERGNYHSRLHEYNYHTCVSCHHRAHSGAVTLPHVAGRMLLPPSVKLPAHTQALAPAVATSRAHDGALHAISGQCAPTVARSACSAASWMWLPLCVSQGSRTSDRLQCERMGPPTPEHTHRRSIFAPPSRPDRARISSRSVVLCRPHSRPPYAGEPNGLCGTVALAHTRSRAARLR